MVTLTTPICFYERPKYYIISLSGLQDCFQMRDGYGFNPDEVCEIRSSQLILMSLAIILGLFIGFS